MYKLALLVAAGAMMVPAAVLAGETVTAGDQSLKFTAKATPAKASAKKKPRGVTVKLGVDYRSLNADSQITERTKRITLQLPAGMKVNVKNAKTCLVSELKEKGATACPKGSKVGQGKATADARPGLGEAIPATITIYNGLADIDAEGAERATPVPAVVLYAQTELGLNEALPFVIDGSNLVTDYATPKEGIGQLFHLQTVSMTLPSAGKKSYMTAPTTCSRKWKFGIEIQNFDGPSVAATHDVPCKKG